MLVARSGLFDARWYLRQYPDVASSWIDPLDHFVRYGGTEQRDPGPHFSSGSYWARYPDVARAAINPLIHYLSVGKAAGRHIPSELFDTIVPVEQAEISAAMATAFSKPIAVPMEAAVPPRFVREAYLPPRPASVSPLSLDGSGERPAWRLGIADHQASLASEDAITSAGEWRLAANLMCQLSGVDPGDWVWQDDKSKEACSGLADWLSSGLLSFRLGFKLRISDIVFSSSHDLRIRLECSGSPTGARLTALQLDPIGGRRSAVVSAVGLVCDGISILDVRLANPYLPVLLTLTDSAGRLLDTTIIPFPSLCRGGSHYGEALAVAPHVGAIDAVRKTSSEILENWLGAGSPRPTIHLEVELTGANGTERLFSQSFKDWLLQVGECTVMPLQQAEPADPVQEWLHAKARIGPVQTRPLLAPRLSLSAACLPSLHALFCGPAGDQGFAPIVLCEGIDGTPQWVLTPPREHWDLGAAQPIGASAFPCWGTLEGAVVPAKAEVTSSDTRPPAALHFLARQAPTNSELVAPFAPDVAAKRLIGGIELPEPALSLSVILPFDGTADADAFTATLEALLLQAWPGSLQVIISAPEQHRSAAEGLLQRGLSQQTAAPELRMGEVVSGSTDELDKNLNTAAERATGQLLLMMSEDVLLHDRRCFQVLAGLLSLPSVTSASCMLITGQWGRKANDFAIVRCGNELGPAFGPITNYSTLFPAAAMAALPPMTWPVEAGAISLFMTRRTDWVQSGSFECLDGKLKTDFWGNASNDGGIHMVTLAVSASVPRPEAGAAAQNGRSPVGRLREQTVNFRRTVA